jgi:hypothetical protein
VLRRPEEAVDLLGVVEDSLEELQLLFLQLIQQRLRALRNHRAIALEFLNVGGHRAAEDGRVDGELCLLLGFRHT